MVKLLTTKANSKNGGSALVDFQGITISYYAVSNSASEFVPFFGLVSSRDPKSKGEIRDLQGGDKKVMDAGSSPGIWAHLLQNLNLI